MGQSVLHTSWWGVALRGLAAVLFGLLTLRLTLLTALRRSWTRLRLLIVSG